MSNNYLKEYLDMNLKGSRFIENIIDAHLIDMEVDDPVEFIVSLSPGTDSDYVKRQMLHSKNEFLSRATPKQLFRLGVQKDMTLNEFLDALTVFVIDDQDTADYLRYLKGDEVGPVELIEQLRRAVKESKAESEEQDMPTENDTPHELLIKAFGAYVSHLNETEQNQDLVYLKIERLFKELEYIFSDYLVYLEEVKLLDDEENEDEE